MAEHFPKFLASEEKATITISPTVVFAYVFAFGYDLEKSDNKVLAA